MPATKYFLHFLLIPSSWLLEEGLTSSYMPPSVGWKNYSFSDCPPVWLRAERSRSWGRVWRPVLSNDSLTQPTFIGPLLCTRPSARPREHSNEHDTAQAFRGITVICRGCTSGVFLGPPHISPIWQGSVAAESIDSGVRMPGFKS